MIRTEGAGAAIGLHAGGEAVLAPSENCQVIRRTGKSETRIEAVNAERGLDPVGIYFI